MKTFQKKWIKVSFCKLIPLKKSHILKSLQNNAHLTDFYDYGINSALTLEMGLSEFFLIQALLLQKIWWIILSGKPVGIRRGVIKVRKTFGIIIEYLNIMTI
ncbi:Mg2+ transport protein [Xenorhabdus mauleonii]|uniref:Mg2+ transport protein n=1 Tax=Xenorhabdus mauleonii TaxID=351675 RepID=A0A1I3HSD9_9GAMM|nr:Mg2+ transport protein [Xenorhabdus mauleonii]SFI38686.1 hypothetical protein SAMN05421680_10149 [Xenorhabdus mauleonii]